MKFDRCVREGISDALSGVSHEAWKGVAMHQLEHTPPSKLHNVREHMKKRGYEQCMYCPVWAQMGGPLWEYHMAGECKKNKKLYEGDSIGVIRAKALAREALLAIQKARGDKPPMGFHPLEEKKPGRESMEMFEIG